MNMRIFLLLALLVGSLQVHAQAVIQVPSQATLQQAFTSVPDGGVIEIAAGTYNAPPGGFSLINIQKRMTVRAASGATVVLNGNGSSILRIANTSFAQGRPITFERLTFSGGLSNTAAVGGAITLSEADATFVGCVFRANAAPIADGGGGAMIVYRSRSLILDSTFESNWAQRYGGAIGIDTGTVAIHNSRFVGNRVNLPNHFAYSLGGAIFLRDSALYVTNSRFDDNHAGFSGGAIYAFGSWTTPRTEIVIANSTFSGNTTVRDPGSPAFNEIDVAGAFQMEDQVRTRIYNSRFVANSAKQGGAVANYRGRLEIYGGAFLGNYARGNLPGEGTGGALVLVSDDQEPAEPQRPTADTVIRNTLFQGRYGSVGIAGRMGGCLFSAGDTNRAYGLGGVSQTGTIAQNRALLDIRNSMFVDCDVQESSGGGVGGGMEIQLTALTLQDSLFIGCDALAGNTAFTGTGGALAAFDNSTTTITRTTFARSTASLSGAALWIQGSNIAMSDSQIVENQIVGPNPWAGAAIYAAPENIGAPRPAVNVTGRIENTVMSNNSGGPMILDYDTPAAPHNFVQYAANRIFPDNTSVYYNSLAPNQHTVAQLNGVVVHGTAKAPTANVGLASAPVVGAMVAAPPSRLPTPAAGDAAGPTPAYLGIAWSGGSATLDGGSVGGNVGLVAGSVGNHVLNVAGSNYSAAITAASAVSTQLSANPAFVAVGGSSTLSWATLAGTFLFEFLDQGAFVPAPAAAGSIGTGALPATTRFRGLLIAEEGGAVATTTVSVGTDLIFRNGFQP